jgi:hypothetical protein
MRYFSRIAAFCMAMWMISPMIARGEPVTQSRADWTVLIYMNGKNSLEEALKNNWDQMARVGDSDRVHILVEMGRLGATPDFGGWSGVKRFRVRLDEQAIAESALVDVAASGGNTDMGDPATLGDFIRWGQNLYPARHYMLVIWNHGQGWRYELARATSRVANVAQYLNESHLSVQDKSGSKAALVIREYPLEAISTDYQLRTSQPGGIRSVSNDDQTGHVLYNNDIALELAAAASDKKVDVLGFDACLMAMLETAYTFRHQADFMVGSEETEPGSGWDYEPFLNALKANPAMQPRDLAAAVVASYRNLYSHAPNAIATMSAIDNARVQDVVGSLDALVTNLNTIDGMAAARAARKPLNTYLTWYNPTVRSSTDLGLWTTRLDAQAVGPSASSAASNLLASLKSAVVDNYASAKRGATAGYGSTGLAIFFPEDKDAFLADPDSPGYVVENPFKPVAFVAESKWPLFLADAFGLPTHAHSPKLPESIQLIPN